MATLNRTLLIKMMGMTGSDNDGEALVALRKANALLKEADLTWEQVLGARPTLGMPVSPAQSKTETRRGTARYGQPASQKRQEDGRRFEGDRVRAMIEVLSTMKHEVSTLMLLAGIKDEFDRKGYVTGAQWDALQLMSKQGTRRGGQWRF